MTDCTTSIFLQIDNGEFIEFNLTLPLQMLFDDAINFVSKTDFEN